MSYLPIEDYGVIGNMRTVALIGRNGSLDWMCFPDFDSPSIFAKILDDQKGGSFCISVVNDDVAHKQLYWPDTNVLVTRFLSDAGVGEIIDFMPIAEKRDGDFHGLIRRVRVLRGAVRFRAECRPAFNYARDSHEVELVSGGAKFRSGKLQLALASDQTLRVDGPAALAEFELQEGESANFELHAISCRERRAYLALRMRTPIASSAAPFSSGATGCGSAPTKAAGARSCIAPLCC